MLNSSIPIQLVTTTLAIPFPARACRHSSVLLIVIIPNVQEETILPYIEQIYIGCLNLTYEHSATGIPNSL